MCKASVFDSALRTAGGGGGGGGGVGVGGLLEFPWGYRVDK